MANYDVTTYSTGIKASIEEAAETLEAYLETLDENIRIIKSGVEAIGRDRQQAVGWCVHDTSTSTTTTQYGDQNITGDLDVDGDAEVGGDLTVTGSVSAGLKVVTKAASGTLTAAECRGCVISNYGQTTENIQTLPAAAEGLHGLVVIGTSGAGAFHLKAGTGDKIYLDGTTLTDGDKASLATPAVGDNFTFFAFQTGASAYDWIVTSGSQGILTDGGA